MTPTLTGKLIISGQWTKPDGRGGFDTREIEAGEAKPATHKHMQVLSPYKPRAKAQSQNTPLGSDYCCTNIRSLTTMAAQTQRMRPCSRTPPRLLEVRGGSPHSRSFKEAHAVYLDICIPKGREKNVTGFMNL